MVSRDEISGYMDDLLDVRGVEDPYLINGVLIEGCKEISKMAFAVDASVENVQKCKDEGAEMLVVHHGIFSRKQPAPLTGHMRAVAGPMMEERITLYGCHIPLDIHPDIGNNAQLCSMLGISVKGKLSGIGLYGELEREISMDDLSLLVEKTLGTRCNHVFDFGRDKVKTVAVCSGGAQYGVIEAFSRDIDCYITGEASHSTYLITKDSGMNMIAAGHYATETVGLKALMGKISERFGIECVFLDSPTGL